MGEDTGEQRGKAGGDMRGHEGGKKVERAQEE